ncbi:DNA-binding transcriptional LysR family regulator [Rhodoblastus acidophilus]|uniref:LysR substrate-binding domain-containing protein n=1 Tax=Rhodoblastus acidophilus TaxID=1074 RepID=UPI0022240758|nr:LysR substrate-binding domain-containing protein [Rhodoblastus acidophilus]MCW2318819.1 DNA-binding transcriptional LysR family regulator [Rhodoblastus acidophilus]
MQMRQIEAFRSVMLTGGITNAAAMLHVSQPSVSRLIGDLERAVGFALFERKGRRLTPTRRAEVFYEAVRQSFTGLDLLEQAARRIQAAPVGTVRVSALSALAGGVLPQAIAEFQKVYPDVRVAVDGQSQRGVEDRVFLGQADLGLGVRQEFRDGVSMSPLATAEYYCALPHGHRLWERELIVAADLEGERLIGPMHESDALWDSIDRTLQQEGVAVRRPIEADLSFPTYCYVASGLGLAIVEPFSAPLFAKLGVGIRRFRPRVTLDYVLIEPAHLGPAPEAVAVLRDAIRRATDALLRQTDRLAQATIDSVQRRGRPRAIAAEPI